MSDVGNVLSAQTAGGTNAAESSKSHGELAQNEFLKLLITQLQQQDPLKPTDSDSFIQQVTGFNQLDQLIKLVKIGEQQLQAQGGTTGGTTNGNIIQPGADYTPPEFQLPNLEEA
jgi:flagellar basal-body rod modification protein FlgD